MGDQLPVFPSIVREAARPLPDESPIHRLMHHGPATCSDAELVSLVAGCSADEARELLHGGLRAARSRDYRFFVPKTAARKRAARLAAALELGRRVAALTDTDEEPVRHSDDIARRLLARHSHMVQEEVGAVYLDGRNRVIREVPGIYRGTINSAAVSTRDIIRIGFELAAVGVIIHHNHPSGDPSPSAEDLLFTRKVREACSLVGMDLLDHVVLGANRFVSMKDRGML